MKHPKLDGESGGNAQIKQTGHTKDSRGSFGTDPQAKAKWTGNSVDLKP